MAAVEQIRIAAYQPFIDSKLKSKHSHIFKKLRNPEQSNQLNFGPIFMPSVRLASICPHLKETDIVRHFNTELSCYRNIFFHTDSSGSGRSFITSSWLSIKSSLSGSILWILSRDLIVQEIVCRLLVVSCSVGFVLTFPALYDLSPILIILPISASVMFIYFAYILDDVFVDLSTEEDSNIGILRSGNDLIDSVNNDSMFRDLHTMSSVDNIMNTTREPKNNIPAPSDSSPGSNSRMRHIIKQRTRLTITANVLHKRLSLKAKERHSIEQSPAPEQLIDSNAILLSLDNNSKFDVDSNVEESKTEESHTFEITTALEQYHQTSSLTSSSFGRRDASPPVAKSKSFIGSTPVAIEEVDRFARRAMTGISISNRKQIRMSTFYKKKFQLMAAPEPVVGTVEDVLMEGNAADELIDEKIGTMKVDVDREEYQHEEEIAKEDDVARAGGDLFIDEAQSPTKDTMEFQLPLRAPELLNSQTTPSEPEIIEDDHIDVQEVSKMSTEQMPPCDQSFYSGSSIVAEVVPASSLESLVHDVGNSESRNAAIVPAPYSIDPSSGSGPLDRQTPQKSNVRRPVSAWSDRQRPLSRKDIRRAFKAPSDHTPLVVSPQTLMMPAMMLSSTTINTGSDLPAMPPQTHSTVLAATRKSGVPVLLGPSQIQMTDDQNVHVIVEEVEQLEKEVTTANSTRAIDNLVILDVLDEEEETQEKKVVAIREVMHPFAIKELHDRVRTARTRKF